MNTELQSPKITINKSAAEIVAKYSTPASFKDLMPPEVVKFEASENSFLFGIKGLPEVRLRLVEVTENQVSLSSTSDKLPFNLRVEMHPHGEKTEAQLFFEGEFNPMLKMLVKKPLQNFIDHLAGKMAQIA